MTRTHDSDVAFIRALAELLRENDLTELEVRRHYGEDDSLDVRVARQAALAHTAPVQVTSAPVAPSPAAPEDAPPRADAAEDPAQDPGAVTSPMVGTAYLASEPGAANFVEVGDAVTEGQTLLIVEAMKTMNQIAAPRAGTVRRILVEDGAPVEYGAPLVILG
jgi:acetyl-CoA carboxylase biotin carboxyl carrier protein